MALRRRWRPDPMLTREDYAGRLLCHGQIGVLEKIFKILAFERIHLSYSSPLWLETSRQVKIRDHQRCRSCGNDRNLVVHHMVPIKHGGTNLPANLKTICSKCHRVRHPEVRKNKYVS